MERNLLTMQMLYVNYKQQRINTEDNSNVA